MLASIAEHVWQSTLFLMAAWLLTLVCRRNAAAIRYWIWFGASVKFLVPLAALQWLGEHVGRSLPEPRTLNPVLVETASALLVPNLPQDATISADIGSPIPFVVATIWALGTITLAWRWLRQWQSIRSILASAPQAPLDMPAPVRVTSSDFPPGVFGVFRPIVILPNEVMHGLDPRQLQAVLAHEVCHLRRRDNLTAAIHKCVETIFWFHPLVWLVGARMLREREAACDESVVDQGYERRVYAESILSVCRLNVAANAAGVAASTGGNLAQRLTSIMTRARIQPVGHGSFTLLLAAVLLACFVPIVAGIFNGAVREAVDSDPVTFEAISLQPSARARWRTTEFDPDSGELLLKNFSIRQLIASAYPWSRVTGEPRIIDFRHYDIEARWSGDGNTSERNVYRQLLKQIVQANFKLQVYVDDRCEIQCER